MSVLIQTSFGDIVVDLLTKKAPLASINFLKLCKLKHFNNALFSKVQKDYVAKVQPEKSSTIWRQTGNGQKYFKDQIDMESKINCMGLLCTSNVGPNLNDSTFFITLTQANLSSLSGKHTIFGKVEQGLDILRKINDTYVDKVHRPHMNIRILHTFVIDDPFDDKIVEGLKEMQIPNSPTVAKDPERLQAVEHLEMLQKCKTQKQMVDATNIQKAKKQALTLQILGDLPDASLKPPDNILFICNLNSVTTQRDLQIIFSRFGPIKSVEIIRDWKTGQSLQYGFIEFEGISACEEAYLKMNNVLIDERRVKVNFSQSVSKLMPKNRNLNTKTNVKPIVERKQHIKEAVTKTTTMDGKRYYGSEKFDFVAPKARTESYKNYDNDRFERKKDKSKSVEQESKEKKEKKKKEKRDKKHRRSESSPSREEHHRKDKKKRKDSSDRSNSRSRHKHRKTKERSKSYDRR